MWIDESECITACTMLVDIAVENGGWRKIEVHGKPNPFAHNPRRRAPRRRART